jgi:hypothetical protein
MKPIERAFQEWQDRIQEASRAEEEGDRPPVVITLPTEGFNDLNEKLSAWLQENNQPDSYPNGVVLRFTAKGKTYQITKWEPIFGGKTPLQVTSVFRYEVPAPVRKSVRVK